MRHIQIGVIREESRGQVATLLMLKDPAAVFNDINKNKGKKQLKKMEKIPAEIAAKIDANQALIGKYSFFSTPSMAWKNNRGEFKSTQGLAVDVKEFFEK